MVTTPGAGSSMTSTTTVLIFGLGDFSRRCFFRGAFFATGLDFASPPARLVLPRDFAVCCALPLAVLLRSFARFFGCAFARFFRLAMISSPSLSTAVQFKSVCAGSGSIKQDCERAHSSSDQT
jgi:hypothetical protein